MSATGNIFLDSLVKIPQGVTESTRVGRKCVIRQIYAKGQIELEAQTSKNTTFDKARVIVYLDKQANGGVAGVTQLLESTSVDSFRNLAESGRFRILADTVIAINSIAGSGDGTTEDYGRVLRTWSFSKLCNIPIEYSAVAGILTEIRSNNIGVLTISDSARTVLGATFRVRFSDS